jgi:multiple sugar transport system substrate-binding protein
MKRKLNGVSRRDLLKVTGAAAAGATVGLFGGKAPAFAQQRTVHVVAWSQFIPDCDALTKKQAEEFEKAEGVKMRLEFINANDIPAKATAAVESKVGPDIFQFQWNQPWLYEAQIEDHTKLAQELGSDKAYQFLKDASIVNGTPRGIPYYAVGNAHVYRKDWFAAAGAQDPNTPGKEWSYDAYLAAGKKLKAAGHPYGITLGHTFGDAPANCYPLLWAMGGREVDEKGKVAINSKETRMAVEMMKELWKGAADEGGLGWDDTSNNRAFYGETISSTQNGASIYVNSKLGKQGPKDLYKVMGHFLNPSGPAGRYHPILNMTHSIMKYSPNKTAAMNWLRFIHNKKNYADYIHTGVGYNLGFNSVWENDPMWKADPALEPFKLNAKHGRTFGWPGPYNRKASEAMEKYIIVDLFAKAVQGESTESVVKWAEGELKAVYERGA